MNEFFGILALVQARAFRNLCHLLVEKGVLTAEEVHKIAEESVAEVNTVLDKVDKLTADDILFGGNHDT